MYREDLHGVSLLRCELLIVEINIKNVLNGGFQFLRKVGWIHRFQLVRVSDAVFIDEPDWLHAHSVRSRKPLHELRKEFGSRICSQAGIHTASQLLRHSSVKVTEQHYVENRKRGTVSFGSLKVDDGKVVAINEATNNADLTSRAN